MAQNTQSKILSIEEQIQKLKEKQKREIAKLEKNTGKRFLEKFKLENKPLDEIYSFIGKLQEVIEIDSEGNLILKESNNEKLNHEQSNK